MVSQYVGVVKPKIAEFLRVCDLFTEKQRSSVFEIMYFPLELVVQMYYTDKQEPDPHNAAIYRMEVQDI